MTRTGWTIAALICLLGQSAIAQTVATSPPGGGVPESCEFSKPARVISSLKELPEFRSEMERNGLSVADVGEKFIPFDIVDEASQGLPHRQFVRAYMFDDMVIVWYFIGGFGTSFNAVVMREHQERRDDKPVLRLTPHKLSGPLCKASQAILDGVRGQNGW